MTVQRSELKADIGRELNDPSHQRWSDDRLSAEINAAIRDTWPNWYLLKEGTIGTVASNTLQYEIPAGIQAEMAVIDARPTAVEIEQGTGEPYLEHHGWQYIVEFTAGKHYLRFDAEPGDVGKTIRMRYRTRQAELASETATVPNTFRQFIVYRVCSKLCATLMLNSSAVDVKPYIEMAKFYQALAEQSKRQERVSPPPSPITVRRS